MEDRKQAFQEDPDEMGISSEEDHSQTSQTDRESQPDSEEFSTTEKWYEYLREEVNDYFSDVFEGINLANEIINSNIQKLLPGKICRIKTDIQDVKKSIKSFIHKIYYEYLGKSMLDLPWKFY